MSKRTLDSFFISPKAKKLKASPPPSPPRLSSIKKENLETESLPTEEYTVPPSEDPTYPHPIANLPPDLQETLSTSTPAKEGRAINHLPDLDLLYFEPFIPKSIEHTLFTFLRRELPFYRVQYKINRGSFTTDINTPRFTTVFGLDSTSVFNPLFQSSPSNRILDATTNQPVPPAKYAKCITPPRPLPACLDHLRLLTEAFTNCTFNICLVNYYATGNDSISYHSDDERFLGTEPAIASFSLGAKRDFLMKHKPIPASSDPTPVILSEEDAKPLKFPLASGDMILMRGRTQSCWLHSIPKRKGGESGQGRINITFRKAMIPAGTANYYQYNVGVGEVYRWDEKGKEMRVWEKGEGEFVKKE